MHKEHVNSKRSEKINSVVIL